MESKVFTLDQTTIKKLLTIFKLVIPDFQKFCMEEIEKRTAAEFFVSGISYWSDYAV